MVEDKHVGTSKCVCAGMWGCVSCVSGSTLQLPGLQMQFWAKVANEAIGEN